ncbi:exodeoxyribonuclease III [Aurantibacillus circumpalustris]|uniref:exodeoxyribonuclease III n=1 Tax=Aurantibacillus circumpalustris TaxID=3036359 RepID=UPI00295B7AFB|nr:exodeoxyribonuclease III [Aurantibacillus circumpalustris]
MRIITYNVNGIRAAMSKGFIDWMREINPDVLCLQEIKASPEQVGVFELEEMGYKHYWYPAQKKGYSGVAIFTKKEPLRVTYGCGIKEYDDEGRILRVDFEDVSVMSVYHPSGSSGDLRQAFKMKWLSDFNNYIHELKKTIPNLVLSGDFNICHKAIDIHNPKSNANTSGFLPEEREWMEQFINSGFIDTFRHFNQEPHQYSWWSYRAGARSKNLGWRIDYNLSSKNLKERLQRSEILPDAKHSDHCPVLLEIRDIV